MTTAHNNLGELDEALVTGARAIEIAGRLGDLRLRLVTTTYLEQAHFFRGDYDRVIELATENLAALPTDWTYESFGNVTPASVYDRCWLVHALARLGRFTEATAYEIDAIRLAQTTQHANTVGMAHYAAGVLYLLKGDWAKARAPIERGLAVFRAGHVLMFLRTAIASSAWVLAQLGEASEALSRMRECEQLGERLAASGVVGHRGWADQSMGRTCLLLGRLDEARRLGERAIESSPGHVGFAAHAVHLLGDIATHPDRFDAESGLSPLPPSPGPRRAARHASPRRPLPPRSRPPVSAHRNARAGARAPHRPRRRCTARWTCRSGWSRRRARPPRSGSLHRTLDGPRSRSIVSPRAGTSPGRQSPQIAESEGSRESAECRSRSG